MQVDILAVRPMHKQSPQMSYHTTGQLLVISRFDETRLFISSFFQVHGMFLCELQMEFATSLSHSEYLFCWTAEMTTATTGSLRSSLSSKFGHSYMIKYSQEWRRCRLGYRACLIPSRETTCANASHIEFRNATIAFITRSGPNRPAAGIEGNGRADFVMKFIPGFCGLLW